MWKGKGTNACGQNKRVVQFSSVDNQKEFVLPSGEKQKWEGFPYDIHAANLYKNLLAIWNQVEYLPQKSRLCVCALPWKLVVLFKPIKLTSIVSQVLSCSPSVHRNPLSESRVTFDCTFPFKPGGSTKLSIVVNQKFIALAGLPCIYAVQYTTSLHMKKLPHFVKALPSTCV